MKLESLKLLLKKQKNQAKFINKGIYNAKALEIKVYDFEKISLLLEQLGYINKGYSENKRKWCILDEEEVLLIFIENMDMNQIIKELKFWEDKYDK